MVLKYTSKRPDEELDGLQDHEAHFKGHQPADIVAVVVVSGHTVVEDMNDGQRTATVRVKQIEPVDGDDAATVRQLLRDRYAKRTGNEPLPIDEIEQPKLEIVEGGDQE
ncbi:hypothetical protein MUN78_04570 [Leucobacter allii]|uniref:Uncharacterized protein n=1 Tax=Leucobacter allii TaxID=2932247 RepID=A0ABY4FPB9_9MICO|nr:hypothetical protein [Leucobacter allii]UOQ58126.1 hypothetical protein MUN78_04570 [Leucobacter allii]